MRKLIVFLMLLGGLIYLYCIGTAAYISLYNVCPGGSITCDLILNPNIVFIVTSIGGVLATNFGAIVGLPNLTGFRLAGDAPKKIQIVAGYVYILGLIVAFVVWLIEGFAEGPKETVALVPELSKTLIGVFAGVLAVNLAKE